MKKLKIFEAKLVMLFRRLLKKKYIKSTGKNFSVYTFVIQIYQRFFELIVNCLILNFLYSLVDLAPYRSDFSEAYCLNKINNIRNNKKL